MSFIINKSKEELFNELSKQFINALKEQGIIQSHAQSESQNTIWLNVEQLCAYLPDHPCRNTIYKWKRKGIIPFHKRSKSLYFLRSEIDAWLKSKRGMTIAEMETKIDSNIFKRGVR
jgi:phosphorylcholine metabolism protein LicD